MKWTIGILISLCLLVLQTAPARAQVKQANIFRPEYTQVRNQAIEHARMGQYEEAVALLEAFRLKHASEPNAQYLIRRAQKGLDHYRQLHKLWVVYFVRQ